MLSHVRALPATGLRALVLVLLGPAAASLLAGCSGDDECDPTVDVCESVDDAQEYTGELLVDEIHWWCCDPESNPDCESSWYWYDVLTVGVAAETSIVIKEEVETGRGWTEVHTLASQAADADGYWDNRYVELGIEDTSACGSLSDCEDRFTSGTNTLFPCTQSWTEERMTWTVRLFSEGAEDPDHCVSWGVGATETQGCEVWDVQP